MESDLGMWWNFVGGSHEEITEARRTWQAEIGVEPSGYDVERKTGYDVSRGEADRPRPGSESGRARFGTVLGYDGSPLPAPTLPGGRLKPRRSR